MLIKDISGIENQYNCVIPEKRVKIWNIQIEMWKAFDKVCRENSIRYYFFWGALLGAVRHGGFIPWDDDIDVVMPREDYNRFAEIAPKYIKLPYFALTPETTEGIYWCMKIIDTRTTCLFDRSVNPVKNYQGISIDIVPLDGCPNTYLKRVLHFIHMRIDYTLLNKRVVDFSTLSLKGKIIKLISILYYAGMPRRDCIRRTERIRSKFNYKDSEEVMESAHYHRFSKKLFDDVSQLTFEGYKVPVPGEYKRLLNELYGDYMQIPSENNRKLTEHEALGWVVEPDISYEDYFMVMNSAKVSIAKAKKRSFKRYVTGGEK